MLRIFIDVTGQSVKDDPDTLLCEFSDFKTLSMIHSWCQKRDEREEKAPVT